MYHPFFKLWQPQSTASTTQLYLTKQPPLKGGIRPPFLSIILPSAKMQPTTTVADLIAMLSQLDASLVTALPPSLSALVGAQPGATNTQAPAVAGPAVAAAAPATAVPATTQPPAAPAAAQPAPATTTAAAPAAFVGVFRCPNCETVHFMAPIAEASPAPSPPPAPNPAAEPAAAAVPSLAPSISQAPSCSASSSTAPAANAASANFVPPPSTPGPSTPSGRWYSVTYGRQVGVYQDWFGVVEPLVIGVPNWKCKAFSTFAAANNHFNAYSAAGLVRVFVDH
ncbi:hypothetical protein EYR36_001813 [Pleurotus pulmonarius]|nr:hypothetical protein EYR36_008245 [Pleurotus pulmonarius]KAF4578208.1 hypothetical protein EYR36_000014 [Pleurotus pulmonarius]KAF4579993.1 hypothetical protein EYR36_001813 [Pleurotus pulmonarius]KAF4604446.1 hypothetical protein EYR38_004869 [Pleurotus pulmonarius]